MMMMKITGIIQPSSKNHRRSEEELKDARNKQNEDGEEESQANPRKIKIIKKRKIERSQN